MHSLSDIRWREFDCILNRAARAYVRVSRACACVWPYFMRHTDYEDKTANKNEESPFGLLPAVLEVSASLPTLFCIIDIPRSLKPKLTYMPYVESRDWGARKVPLGKPLPMSATRVRRRAWARVSAPVALILEL